MRCTRKRQELCRKGTGEERKVKAGQEVHRVSSWREERASIGRTSSSKLL